VTPAENAIAIEALIDLVQPVVNSMDHDVALAALLTLVRVCAKQHPCCTVPTAEQCVSLGLELARWHDTNQKPSGAPTH
jgi:hypothetical protein